MDSSTQSTKVVLCRADDGAGGRRGRRAAPRRHRGATPGTGGSALDQRRPGLLDGAAAVAVAGQQHGMVALDGAGEVVRPALLWNDTRSAPQAAPAGRRAGRPGRLGRARSAACRVASFTVTKLRWLAEHEPERPPAPRPCCCRTTG